ncbi:MAG: class I SAM-dependent methyltransferase [Gammaproteobacteria bacterium]|nr:class I SAM-dependent methyltransferase [Gammaproteobacteria bacterium]
MSRENDHALRFYHEVLGLDHLHYGLWNDDDDLTFENLKRAQQRYEDFLVDNIPTNAKSILDVGCGTSALTKRLLDRGLEVEGLSPDQTQKDLFTSTLEVPFHHTRFENFSTNRTYDCLIMSESAQYIPLKQLFDNARTHLAPGGHLLVFDYFINDHAQGIFAKSGHNYRKFVESANNTGFRILRELDYTHSTIKTLDLGRQFADRAKIALEILTEKPKRRHPRIYSLVNWAFRKKIKHLQEQMQLLDSERFRNQKKYVFFEFQCLSG